MTTLLEPDTVQQLVEVVRSTAHLRATGAGTKPRLSAGDATPLSTARLRGMIEYDPSEFTFTALAGTPVKEIAAALAERGQYLPFDPMLVESGSTLGGTLAAGLSGPGRFRFGGIRDFVLGVRFVDGSGRLLRLGSKVVKSAAGFDLPKFFVGSLGRFGILAELTFKVFPRPASRLTLRLTAESIQSATRMLIESGNKRWQPDAVDIVPGGKAVYLRLAGPSTALEKIAAQILSHWAGEVLPREEADSLWSDLLEFRWAYQEGPLFKVPLTPEVVSSFYKTMSERDGARIHLSAGRNVAFVSLRSNSDAKALDENLRALGLSAVALRGDVQLRLGVRQSQVIAASVKQALDPGNRFPAIEN